MEQGVPVTTTVLVTLALFLITQTIALFRWISGISSSLEAIAVKMEERTAAMMNDLKKVNDSLQALATADLRLSNAERGINDHESRIRDLEDGVRSELNGRNR